jgi:hypothetical protein
LFSLALVILFLPLSIFLPQHFSILSYLLDLILLTRCIRIYQTISKSRKHILY